MFDTVRKTEILPSDMLGYKYLEALPAVAAGDANKLLLLPSGASDGMGAVAGLGAAFAQGAAPTTPIEAASAAAPPAAPRARRRRTSRRRFPRPRR